MVAFCSLTGKSLGARDLKFLSSCAWVSCGFGTNGISSSLLTLSLAHYRSHLMNSNSHKPSNPKDAVGVAKPPSSTASQAVSAEVGLAMIEGARKYGRHNYRVIGVRSSI